YLKEFQEIVKRFSWTVVIAEYYMEHGIETVAISANTPLNERRTNIEKFKDGQIQILVNVDLFGEGFDCPDVEFVQLARPTLSLAKYLQMVGRGLRVAKDKECCTILDNVGLYRLFGLPTAEWNWEAMFRGMEAGKGEIDVARDLSLRNIDIMDNAATTQDQNTDMVVISRHDQPKVYFQLAELQKMFRKTAHLRRMGSGYMGAGQYIRIGDKMQGMYKTYEDVRLNWRLVSKTEGGITKYYLLHELNERMIYVGRKDPWSPLAVDAKEQYLYNTQGAMQEVKALEREYITGEKRKQPSNSIRKEIDGEMCLVTYAYYAVNKNRGNDFNSKDAYVCEHYMNGGYAISNNKHQIILDNLKSVKLSDDNIAEVVFIGEEKPTWVNLYTMQEFDERPVVERVGFMDMLRVDNNYYFYKNRDLTGIPMFDWSCIANDRIFLFLDLYVILRDQPDKVYYMDGERRGSDQWYLKLIDIANPNIKNFKEVPSSWLPKRN
ncbi:DEAD/DEAH box helicase, partial [Prevotella pectinovora]|uniref:DEAD/DEAH box helicase n=1 Tax=Prevotella pectinovora TaxID=1602169 RepID=UPI00307EB68B